MLQHLITQFRARYPQAGLVSDLLIIQEGRYVVRTVVQMGGEVIATGLAAAPHIEDAEDQSVLRSLRSLGIGLNIDPSVDIHAPSQALKDHPQNHSQDYPQKYSETAASAPPETADSPSRPGPKPERSLPTILPGPLAASTPSASTATGVGTVAIATQPPALHPVPEPWDAEPSLGLGSPSDVNQPSIPYPETSTWGDGGLDVGEAGLSTVDRSDDIAKIMVEMQRLGWTKTQGREHLRRTYGKETRQELTDSELLDFLSFLEGQPS